MELPFNLSDFLTPFWIKFVIIFIAIVVTPLFFMSFTGEVPLKYKIIGMILGAIAIYMGMIGKTLRGFSGRRR